VPSCFPFTKFPMRLRAKTKVLSTHRSDLQNSISVFLLSLSSILIIHSCIYLGGLKILGVHCYWKQDLENNKYVTAMLIYISKVFDCLPHQMIIAKLKAYWMKKRKDVPSFGYTCPNADKGLSCQDV